MFSILLYYCPLQKQFVSLPCLLTIPAPEQAQGRNSGPMGGPHGPRTLIPSLTPTQDPFLSISSCRYWVSHATSEVCVADTLTSADSIGPSVTARSSGTSAGAQECGVDARIGLPAGCASSSCECHQGCSGVGSSGRIVEVAQSRELSMRLRIRLWWWAWRSWLRGGWGIGGWGGPQFSNSSYSIM